MTPEETATNSIKDFFKNPQVSKAVVDMVVRNRPVGWSRRSNAPYYKEVYALGLKVQIDSMLSDRKDRIFRYDQFPQHSKETLYLRINQALRYLLDNLDDANKTYAKWNEMVAVTRERGLGIRISYRPEFRESGLGTFVSVPVESKSTVPLWKQRVDDYLEDGIAGDKPLHLTGLCLTSEQLVDLKTSLKGLSGVMSSVDAHEIKIIKTS